MAIWSNCDYCGKPRYLERIVDGAHEVLACDECADLIDEGWQDWPEQDGEEFDWEKVHAPHHSA